MNFIKDSEHKVQLEKLLLKADRIIICSGWLLNDGIKLIENALKTAIRNEATIIIYSSVKHTEKKELNKLKKYSNFTHKILAKSTGKVHTKLYYFKHGSTFTAIVGSANITKGGLQVNKELSIKIEDSIGSENYNELQSYIMSLDKLES